MPLVQWASVVWIIWISDWSVNNLPDGLTACVSRSVKLCYHNDTAFPDLSEYFGEYNVDISDINDDENYKNKTQVVLNNVFLLMIKL